MPAKRENQPHTTALRSSLLAPGANREHGALETSVVDYGEPGRLSAGV